MAYLDDHGVRFINSPNNTTPPNETNLNKIQTDLVAYLEAKLAESDPVGRLVWEITDIVPTGWLAANGQVVTSTYPVLRSALITKGFPYGDDGSGNPRLPDIRGRVVIGTGQGSGLTNRALGAISGAESVLLTGRQSGIQQHNHPATPNPDHNFVIRDFTKYTMYEWINTGGITGRMGNGEQELGIQVIPTLLMRIPICNHLLYLHLL